MKKKKDLEDIKHTWKCNSLEIEKEMKRIADNIFGYNPKTDPVILFLGALKKKERERKMRKTIE